MITIKKNPETVGKLKVGTIEATPADGEVIAKKATVEHATLGRGFFKKTGAKFVEIGAGGTGSYVGYDSSGYLEFASQTGADAAGYSTKMKIDSSGNVSIGTAGTHTLHVQKDVDDYIAKFENDGNATTSNGVWIDTRWNTTTNSLFKVTTNSGAQDVLNIAGSGNVGIGTPTPTVGNLQIRDASVSTFALTRTTGNTGASLGIIRFGNTDVDSNLANIVGYQDGATDSAAIAFQTQATGGSTGTRLTISSTGDALFNTSSTSPGNGNQNTGVSILSNGRVHLSTNTDNTVNRNSDGVLFQFRRSNSEVGSIAVTSSATAYNTSSDYRLKENLEPLTGALDRLDALPVYRFNFKAAPDTTVDGFVAHEVSAHVPEAVTGEKDAMQTVVVQEAVAAQPATYYDEGDELPEGKAVGDEKTPAVEAVAEVTEEQPDYQGIDQSKLVPLLVAAVKELKAKVEALESAE